jgi:hypothetical protein
MVNDHFGMGIKQEFLSPLFSSYDIGAPSVPQNLLDDEFMPFPAPLTNCNDSDLKFLPFVGGNQTVPSSWPADSAQFAVTVDPQEMSLLARQGAQECCAALERVKEEDEDSDAKSSNASTNGSIGPMRTMRGKQNLTAQEQERVIRRRRKNREAAQKSRLRKRQRLESLEQQLADHMVVYQDVVAAKNKVDWENKALREELERMKKLLASAAPSLVPQQPVLA